MATSSCLLAFPGWISFFHLNPLPLSCLFFSVTSFLLSNAMLHSMKHAATVSLVRWEGEREDINTAVKEANSGFESHTDGVI